MKKFLKYTFLTLLALVVAAAIGLTAYYNHLYQDTPAPPPAEMPVQPGRVATRTDKPVLLPVPHKVAWVSGVCALPAQVRVSGPAEDTAALAAMCRNRLGVNTVAGATTAVQFVKKNDLAAQAYRLQVGPGRIEVAYNTLPGAFYALTTVRQMAQQTGRKVPCADIEDQPDLDTRGAMLDVSRGKVPKLETLFQMVDCLADLKYNHLQLYIEGFSFAYPSFERFWKNTETPLTPEEIRRLDAYCRERYIELAPNQNSLGHMQAWLQQPELKDLAECPEGYKLFGLIDMKTTLSPTNPGSLALVKQMSEDLLPNFTSSQFNVNLDEPFELGKSKQRPISDPVEIARLYLDYARQLNDYVNSKGKTMLMWGDVVSNTPGVLKDIPKNVTLLEWRYESFQPFDAICQQYQQAGVRYLVCPGTSTWSSFTGRTDNMLANIEKAVSAAVRFGGAGMLVTDWGDTPHLQYLTVSYAGLAHAAALSWNFTDRAQEPLEAYLSYAVFGDKTGLMGPLVLDMGRYNRLEEYPMMAMTTTGLAMRFGMMDKVLREAINRKMETGLLSMAAFDAETKNYVTDMFRNAKPYQAAAIVQYADSLETALNRVHLTCADSALIVPEYRNALRMVRLGARLKQYNLFHLQQTAEQNKALLLEMKALCAAILPEHERLWMQRNKSGGYPGSVEGFQKLGADVQHQIDLLEGGSLKQALARGVEKMATGAAALYLK